MTSIIKQIALLRACGWTSQCIAGRLGITSTWVREKYYKELNSMSPQDLEKIIKEVDKR